MLKKTHAKNENQVELQCDKCHRVAVSARFLYTGTGDLVPGDFSYSTKNGGVQLDTCR